MARVHSSSSFRKRIPFAKRWLHICAGVCLISSALLTGAVDGYADPLTVSNVFNILDTISPNDVQSVAPTGTTIFFGSNAVSPSGNHVLVPGGPPNTTGSGQTTNLTTGATFTKDPLPFTGDTAFPNQISDRIPDNLDLRGPWTLTFRNGADTAVVQTPFLVGVTPLPFASNVTITSGTNPTFTWTNPGSQLRQFINIIDKDLKDTSGRPDFVLNAGLPANSTTFTVPGSLAGGLTLDPTHHYAIEISETQLRDPTGPFMHFNELRISRAVLDFTALPSGAPPNTYVPFVDPLTGAFHFNMTVIANQVFFLDPLVAIGYDFATGVGDPNFASAIFPSVGDNLFDVFNCNGASLGTAQSGVPFSLGAGGLNCFRVRGIEPGAGIDPTNATAFVTGLSFVSDGTFTGTMTPITAVVPQPSSLLLGSAGFILLILAAHRARVRSSRSRTVDARKRVIVTTVIVLVTALLCMAIPVQAQTPVTVEQIVGTWEGTLEYASSRTNPGGSTKGTLIIKPDGTWTGQAAVTGAPPANGTYELKGNVARSVILSPVPSGWGNTVTWTFTEKDGVLTLRSVRDDKNTTGTYVKK